MEEKTIKGFKGFDKNLKCRGFQYEVGETYETDEVELCKKGFHFCENPFNVFEYYNPAESRFCQVEAGGDIKSEEGGEKSACSRIKIGAELTLDGFIEAGVKFILDKIKWENKESDTGGCSVAKNTGNYSAATNTGNCSAATNTGDRSAATVKGKESVAVVIGKESKASGALGCWIVLTERGEWNGYSYPIIEVKAFKVDGEKIKENVFYTLVNGEAVEVE